MKVMVSGNVPNNSLDTVKDTLTNLQQNGKIDLDNITQFIVKEESPINKLLSVGYPDKKIEAVPYSYMFYRYTANILRMRKMVLRSDFIIVFKSLMDEETTKLIEFCKTKKKKFITV